MNCLHFAINFTDLDRAFLAPFNLFSKQINNFSFTNLIRFAVASLFACKLDFNEIIVLLETTPRHGLSF